MKEDDRILIFTSDEQIESLSKSEIWYSDASYKVAPKSYMQLLTIHSIVKRQSFPAAFIFMKKRTESTYRVLKL